MIVLRTRKASCIQGMGDPFPMCTLSSTLRFFGPFPSLRARASVQKCELVDAPQVLRKVKSNVRNHVALTAAPINAVL